MNTIVICTVVWICATIVYGNFEVYDQYDEETELSYLKYEIRSFLAEYKDIINRTISEIDSSFISKRAELTSKPVVETLDQILLQMMEAAKGGATKTHCYKTAKINARTVREHASDAMTACAEEYKKIIRDNVTAEFELLKTAYMKYSHFENDITDRLHALEFQYEESLKNILTVTSENSLRNSTELKSCLNKFIPSLTADLQNVQSHASACILAS